MISVGRSVLLPVVSPPSPLLSLVIYDSSVSKQLLFMQQDFFRKLMDLFRICEDLEDIDGLHLIFKIVKGIGLYPLILDSFHVSCIYRYISTETTDMQVNLLQLFAVLLNSAQIFERIFGEELIMDICGCLECKFFFAGHRKCIFNNFWSWSDYICRKFILKVK